MSEISWPKIYLVSPPELDLSGTFPEKLKGILTVFEIACFRLQLSSEDEYEIGTIADCMREICHARNVTILINNHMLLVEKFGLDGIHLTDGSRNIAKARKLLGKDAIVGAFCGLSRHTGMTAGEAGADYVSFGPVSVSGLNNGEVAKSDLFNWWSELVELPIVAEGRLTAEKIKEIGSVTDFLAFGQEISESENPGETLGQLMSAVL